MGLQPLAEGREDGVSGKVPWFALWSRWNRFHLVMWNCLNPDLYDLMWGYLSQPK